MFDALPLFLTFDKLTANNRQPSVANQKLQNSFDFAMSEDCTVVRFSREPSSARIETLKQTDGGYPEKHCTDFSGFYVTCVLISVITYIADLVLVCVLLYFYAINSDDHLYFALTLSFLLLPALLMTAFNFRW